jgi:transcription antitermination factor NusG
MGYWACAQTEPHREGAAAHFLGLAGYTAYCPRIRAVHIRRGGRKIVTRAPLFPSYLFVAIVAGWWDARWCPGIVRLLAAGDAPMPVSNALISEIKSRERDGLVELPRRERFIAGEQVRVLTGPFSGCLGLYQGMRSRDRILVLLALLGGQARVELDQHNVEAAPQ